jgi:3-methylcrotonyl-CoA carboxylase alpha subunit
VEFLVDEHGQFYFIEMNTRIQVEHAVTEMITGIDLVEWQLRIAAGEPLPLTQQQIAPAGHAIEARVYAEVPEAGFLPSGGTVHRFELPAATDSLRLESGVQTGDSVGVDYDPLLAKLIVRAATRAEAMAGLASALAQVRIGGVGNNLLFLRRLLASAALRAGGIDTGFIEREVATLTGTYSAGADAAPATGAAELALAAAALWTLEQERHSAAGATHECVSPWQWADGWRLNGILVRTLQFELTGASGPATGALAPPASRAAVGVVGVEYRPQGTWLAIGTHSAAARLVDLGHGQYSVCFGDHTARVQMDADAGELRIGVGLDQYRLSRHDPLAVLTAAQAVESDLAAPMPGRIIAQLVRTGEAVTKGTALLIMEAMKMEYTIVAPADGTVRAYRAAVGAQVQEGARLLDFEPRP